MSSAEPASEMSTCTDDDRFVEEVLLAQKWQLVVNLDKSHDRSGRPDENRDHELKQGPAERRSSNARQLGCVFQDMKPPKFILWSNF